MTINPDSVAALLPETMDKVRELVTAKRLRLDIEVDGRIDGQSISCQKEAGGQMSSRLLCL